MFFHNRNMRSGELIAIPTNIGNLSKLEKL